jgi:hypothetical protein
MTAIMGGVLCLGLYKLHLYINNREQFRDSNALVSLVFILIATAFIFLILTLVSLITHSSE